MLKMFYYFEFYLFLLGITKAHGTLYPFPSETREVHTLDGMWKFLKSDPFKPSQGIDEKWYEKDLEDVGNPIDMPVPASFNDVTSDRSIRDHVGLVWYQRKFIVPQQWANNGLVWIRFGSVHYEAKVWINGEKVAEHSIGHLPFDAEISKQLKFTGENQITVSVDNRLSNTTIPQGKVVDLDTTKGKKKTLDYLFDFYNYAGIHRSVHLVHTPETYIEDIDLLTAKDTEGKYILNYKISSNGAAVDGLRATVSIFNRNGTKVASGSTDKLSELNSISMPKKVHLWWPYLMDPIAGYMYNIEVRLETPAGNTVDVYRLKYGFRMLSWSQKRFLINGKEIYFRGFGRHEDSDIRGRGFDYPLLAKDFDLLRWIGANSYRTTHYPYSEESMQLADEYGMMVIDECSSVKTGDYNDQLLENHKSSLAQLIKRDKNHPSVVMWSIANEPLSGNSAADSYFNQIANYTRFLDPHRPITAALNTWPGGDYAAQYLDIINFNRYNGWYNLWGNHDAIAKRLLGEATQWHTIYKKPVIMGEYGADTLEGMHALPDFIWSEEYQREIFSQHFKVFDQLRRKENQFFIGEFIWNFADFKTKQTHTRVGGNKKGVFQRNRQPKSGAYLVRNRYHSLAKAVSSYYIKPTDLNNYVIDTDEYY